MTSDKGLQTVRNFAINGTGLAPNLNTRSEFVGGRITSVELAITVLSDEGVAILKRNPFGGNENANNRFIEQNSFRYTCLLYTSPSPRDRTRSRMPSSA